MLSVYRIPYLGYVTGGFISTAMIHIMPTVIGLIMDRSKDGACEFIPYKQELLKRLLTLAHKFVGNENLGFLNEILIFSSPS